MEKLPPTSYVRMVDVWLIFGQLIPFIEVSLLTIIELYNDDLDRVNHHGSLINTKSNVSIFQGVIKVVSVEYPILRICSV